MRIDAHAHIIPEEFLRWAAAHPGEAQADLVGGRDSPDGRRMVHRQGYAYPVPDSFWEPTARRAQMAAGGLDFMLLSPAPPLFYYWADPRTCVRVARLVNDGVARAVREEPSRLGGLATLPLADPAAAAAELYRTTGDLRLRGALIGTDVEGESLTDPRFTPVWEAADDLGAVLYLHPYYVGDKERLNHYYLTNLLGNPWATTLAAADLILSGHLDRYPNVRLVLAHAGGFLPYQIGRLNHGYAVRPETRAAARHRPEEYLRRFWYDTVAFHGQALAFLVSLVGADRVLLGSDFPFDMAEWPPGKLLDAAGPIDPRTRTLIESENARDLFNIAGQAASTETEEGAGRG